MALNPPDRGPDPRRQPSPLNFVRGGSICQPGEKGGHLVRGSMAPAVCMPTVGADTRPRWKTAGMIGAHRPSRHSVHYLQHRASGE